MNIDDSLKVYLKYVKYEKNLSANTVNAYSKDLLHFINYLKNLGISKTSDLSLDAFRKYLKYIDNFKYSNRTIIRKYSSYMNFFRFLEDNQYTNIQLTQLINVPKKHHRFYSFLSQKEIETLLESIKPVNYASIRNRTLIELIYSTGARVSEAAGILLKDVDLKNREISVTGKGRKQRILYLNQSALKWIEIYLKVRDKIVSLKNRDKYAIADYLFLNKFGKKLSVRSIRTIVKESLKRAGIEKNITPHGIRHTFATHLLQEGAGIREIQELLGHKNISTTQIYTHLNIKKLKRDYDSFHPRAG